MSGIDTLYKRLSELQNKVGQADNSELTDNQTLLAHFVLSEGGLTIEIGNSTSAYCYNRKDGVFESKEIPFGNKFIALIHEILKQNREA